MENPESLEAEKLAYDVMCTDCGLIIANKNENKSHLCTKMRHGPYKKTTFCRHCRKHFKTPFKYKRHAALCQPMLSLKVLLCCRECKERFTHFHLFKRHYLSQHTKSCPYSCDSCSLNFPTSAKLYYHRKFRHGWKNLTCSTCGAQQATSQMYLNHMRTKHTHERSLVCSECGKSFKNSSCLSQHKKTHSSSGDYECPLCGTIFRRKHDMKRHVLKFHISDETCEV